MLTEWERPCLLPQGEEVRLHFCVCLLKVVTTLNVCMHIILKDTPPKNNYYVGKQKQHMCIQCVDRSKHNRIKGVKAKCAHYSILRAYI